MLNELDKELERRGLHFVRYAIDCIIVVSSSAAVNRVLNTITKWIGRKLVLKVNATKSKVTNLRGLKYLGFGFYKHKGERILIPHNDSVKKFEMKLKRLTIRKK